MELQLDISYEQVLALVKQLPANEKMKLTRELEQEGIESRLSSLLQAFQTDELSLNMIDEEVETVRQEIYDREKQ